MMSAYIVNCILRMVAFACITAAAIHFESAKILWWYLLPLAMTFSGQG